MKKKLIIVLSVLLSLFLLFGVCGAQNKGSQILNQVSKSTMRIEIEATVNLANYLNLETNKYVSMGASGTGFFINDRHIVTNHHVVSKSYLKFQIISAYLDSATANAFYRQYFDSFWFTSSEGDSVSVVYSATGNDIVNGLVVADFPELDLAIIEIDPAFAKRTPIKLSSGSNITEGMDIYVVGYPGVMEADILTRDKAAITYGILSKINKDTKGYRAESTPFTQLAFDATVNHGNSGGPIVDSQGNVIGIVSSGTNPLNGIAYYGIHVDELINRLKARNYSYTSADSVVNSSIIMWIIIGVLGLAVIGLIVFLLTKPTKGKTVRVKQNGNQEKSKPAPAFSAKSSIQGLSGQFQGQQKPLSTSKDTIIGKDPSVCTLKFDESAKNVSRKHCRIHYSNTNQCFVIQDLGSTNGTILVRGSSQTKVPTNTSLKLKNGDLVYIPTKENTFRINL